MDFEDLPGGLVLCSIKPNSDNGPKNMKLIHTRLREFKELVLSNPDTKYRLMIDFSNLDGTVLSPANIMGAMNISKEMNAIRTKVDRAVLICEPKHLKALNSVLSMTGDVKMVPVFTTENEALNAITL